MYQDKMLIKYGLAAMIGILMGFKILPPIFTGILFGGLMIAFIIYAFNNKIEDALLVLPFIVFGEIFFRGHARAYLPYLSVQYMYIIGFGILLAKNKLQKKTFISTYCNVARVFCFRNFKWVFSRKTNCNKRYSNKFIGFIVASIVGIIL
jgi:predicted benzoate:H+ symporter BenE